MPTVSICLPVYNGERFLDAAIESVFAQTHDDYELLISDDCSADSSLEIARAYARADRRVTVWSNSRRLGLFANYNACMRRAGGQYIKLFAQDDLLAPTMVARSLEAFSGETNAALVSTARLAIDEQGRPQEFPDRGDLPRVQSGQAVTNRCLTEIRNLIGEPSTVMFPRAFAGDGFDTSFAHSGDLEYWLRIISNGDFVFLNEPLCCFRQHKKSATNGNMKSMLFALDMLRLGRIYRRQLADLGIEEKDHVRRVMEFSSWYVNKLVEEEGVTCHDSAAVEVADADKDRLLTEFRELAFCALSHSQDTLLRAEQAKAEADYARRASEEKLRRVLASRTWRAVQALRKLTGTAREEQLL